MIETAIGSRNEVTVVLLGQGQAASRARARHYYQQAGVSCVALEAQACTAAQALGESLNHVATAYVVLALDTDFVLASALDNAATCLHAQPEVVAAQGYALGYASTSDQVAYYRIGVPFEPAASSDGRARLAQYANAGQYAWRAVMRLSTLQTALAELPGDLDLAGLQVALSFAILAQGPVAYLPQTGVVAEHASAACTQVVRDERLARLVRTLRNWDADHYGLCADPEGFDVLNQFVRNTYDADAAPLIFTSHWRSVIDDPEREFESRQEVGLPYYNSALFAELTALEFLSHAWPTGAAHRHALEGIWVRQRDLLQQHPNDTPQSLLHRYWQALALSRFNAQVCRRLLPMLAGDADAVPAAELVGWLARLEQVPGIASHSDLEDTPSGQVIAAVAAGTPDEAGRQRVLAHLGKHPAAQIAFVVLDLQNDDEALQATFDSLLASGLRNFKLLVLKAGKPPAITTARDTLHFIHVSESNWVTHLNQAIRQLPSEWLMLLQAGDVLLAGGLLRLAVELTEAPACQAIAANEVQRDGEGRLHSVVRPGADLDLLRSQPGLMSRHWLVRRQAVIDLGGYGEACRNALELDLLLRLVEAQGLACLAHMDDFLVIGQQASPALLKDAFSVLSKHLTQLGYRSQISSHGSSGLVVDYRLDSTPLVSILLAFEGDVGQLQACLASVLQRTRYPRFEILLACASDQFDIEGVAGKALAGRVRLLGGDPGASREALLNLAARHARGEYLLLLSARCNVVTPAWIECLLNEAQRPEVGVVGARLLAEDGRVAHAGYELLAGNQVYLPWRGLTAEQVAGDSWASSVRSCAAVSADCLMLRKAVFEACEGLQAVPGADINLCLAVREAGLMVLWTPRSQLLVSPATLPDDNLGEALAARWPAAFNGQLQFGHGQVPAASLDWLTQLG
ncbi:glycosyl transferase [Pseudomonas sp. S37]|uniref:glycosyl transferase n=1 Tax=Pseudomonas sp. S37 TaxID=2767449 RepID=UPI001F42DABF|nr:glycosyl transferase [Pseudomonas sp. S37]MBK4994432.1 glycosyl transferase [Pseudomonas sp. S37]